MPNTYPDPRTQGTTIVRFGTPFTPFTTAKPVNFTATGDTAVVAAVAAQSVYVYRLFIVASAATTITIKDGVAGTALTGAMSIAAGGSIMLDMSGDAWFATTAGNAFVISQSGTAQISGAVYYVQN